MDWFLYDNGLRHEGVNLRATSLLVLKKSRNTFVCKFCYAVASGKFNLSALNFRVTNATIRYLNDVPRVFVQNRCYH